MSWFRHAVIDTLGGVGMGRGQRGTGTANAWRRPYALAWRQRGCAVNIVPHGPNQERPDQSLWSQQDVRSALADRDITQLYRLLQRYGHSQQYIAALTGQSQPEVSAIIHGRKVMAYDLLVRISGGLGIPGGYLGLACCECPHTQIAAPAH
jgi:hypothetical protein